MLGSCSVLIYVDIILTHIDRLRNIIWIKRSVSSGNLLDSLLTLSLADLRLLVTLGQDFSEGSTNNGSLEFLSLAGLLLGLLFLLSLLVLTSITKHCQWQTIFHNQH